jgi:hypothetical protein
MELQAQFSYNGVMKPPQKIDRKLSGKVRDRKKKLWLW